MKKRLLSLPVVMAWCMVQTSYAVPTPNRPIPLGDYRSSVIKERIEAGKLPPQPKALSLTTADVEATLSGRILEDFVGIRNAYSLNSVVLPDWIHKIRHRMDLRFSSNYGKEKYGEPAAEGCINLLNMHWWREFYSNLYLQTDPVVISLDQTTGYLTTVGKGFDRINQVFTNPGVSSHIPVISFTEGWIATHFDRFTDWFSERPHTLKVGYFPYQLGRGISLGYSDEGGIGFLGYELFTLAMATPFYSPGLLWQGTISENFGYEFYYSVWRRTYSQSFQRDALDFRPRLDKARLNLFGKDLHRSLWTGKVTFTMHPDDDSTLYAEPYFLWMRSTYHRATVDQKLTDRDTNLGTYGMMVDYKSKRVEVNVELAGQFGEIEMFPFDRNELILYRDVAGRTPQAFTKVRMARLNSWLDANGNVLNPIPTAPTFDTSTFDTSREELTPATNSLLRIVDSPDVQNRGSTNPIRSPSISPPGGDPFVNGVPEYDDVLDLRTGRFINSKTLTQQLTSLATAGTASATELLREAPSRYVQAFNNPNRFRPGFDIRLRGFMALADVTFHIDSIPLDLHGAIGYISGGSNPFTETDNTYNGFLPLRDIKYHGHAVKSLAILHARIIPRPADGNFHVYDCSNLALIGVGSTWTPRTDKDRLQLNSNIIWWIQPSNQRIFKLNQPVLTCPTPPSCATSCGAPSCTAAPCAAISGEQPDWASKDLGLELNSAITYRPLPNVTFLGRGAIFFPGQLYKDRDAQTLTFFTTTGTENVSPGKDIAWGYDVRIEYAF